MTQCLSVLGSTGSIGVQTLDVAEHLGIRIVALAARKNVELMELQARKFLPRLVVMYERDAANQLRQRLAGLQIQVLSGMEGLLAAAEIDEADTVLMGVVGMVGLEPTLAAIRKGKTIALANKETLVCAGELVMREAEKYCASILPVDSEHSAVFQCLQGCGNRKEIHKLILTCSGGVFYGQKRNEVYHATPETALRNPNWDMGAKVTIDSATLMNKGLEIIEAMRLYCLPLQRIEVVIHRESIIHSMVEFCDGAVLAQLAVPDMRLQIQYALTYPNRRPSQAARLDLQQHNRLTFAEPDLDTFPCLYLAMRAAEMGGTACTVLNSANEAAVALFLQGKIVFGQIAGYVQYALQHVKHCDTPELDEILQADSAARAAIEEIYRHDSNCAEERF